MINSQKLLSRDLKYQLTKQIGLIKNVNPSWLQFSKELLNLISKQPLYNFLRWPIIQKTMFVRFRPYILKEFLFLKTHDWSIWQSAIKESEIGNPPRFVFYPKTSSNLIHHAYHIAKFKQLTSFSIYDVDQIFEFGGGYGSMCRLFYQLGFTGKYLIYDLPPFSSLQNYYLKSLGYDSCLGINKRYQINCVYNVNILKDHLKKIKKKTLFIATWSLSEAPIEIRNQILNLLQSSKFFLIAYQNKFDGVDNKIFFTEWISNHNHIKWYHFPITHIKNNYYLFGVNNL